MTHPPRCLAYRCERDPATTVSRYDGQSRSVSPRHLDDLIWTDLAQELILDRRSGVTDHCSEGEGSISEPHRSENAGAAVAHSGLIVAHCDGSAPGGAPAGDP